MKNITKLIIAVVSGDDSSKVARALTKSDFRVTKLATTGGFLMAGNTTFLVGVEEGEVEEVLEILRKNSKTRKQMVPTSASYGVGMFSSTPIEVQVGGATVFIVNVERFETL
ncbi:MAG: cyclic-di-AMP receptor [Oscillospiraceae bacterium]|nr:cyclic-di-AMP receptor [Oscillospiraceae bacterium]